MNGMRRWAGLVAWMVAGGAVGAQEIGFVEHFALAEDRAGTLERLIPGSDDFYFYRSLYLQHAGELAHVEPLLEEWSKRHGRTPRQQVIRNRQALLSYSSQPKKTLAHLRHELGLQFLHRADQQREAETLPSRLDDALIQRDTLQRAAWARYEDLRGISDAGLQFVRPEQLDAVRRRHFLERLRVPDIEGLVDLVLQDLQHEGSRGFGSLAIHRQLLVEQLDECLRRRPELRHDEQLVRVYIAKLRPSTDVDWRYDAGARRNYLDRLWSFVESLAPSHNSLKAHVLYHQLTLDRAQGQHDRQRLLRYLSLPRPVGYVSPRLMQRAASQQFPVDLQVDFRQFTGLPPVGDDEPLVRAYLQHFFASDSDYQTFLEFVEEGYLKELFAETKLLLGLGDATRWFSLLPPQKLQALRDRVELDFAPTSRGTYGPHDPVSLEVAVKNAPQLIVKVFKINSQSHYRQHGIEINTDIQLDGLVAKEEQVHTFDEPAIRRVRRTLEFPQLSQPGIYVIDLIGGGKSSRAVIRKGQHRFLVRSEPAGQVFTVLDEANQRQLDAVIWLAGREFAPTATGEIVVPYSTQPGTEQLVITQGDFSTLHEFSHVSEAYRLQAGFHVDRESLLPYQKAPLLIRPRLTLNDAPMSLSGLKDVRLEILATDQDGVQSSHIISDLALVDGTETVCHFQVPPRLRQLRFSLSGKVRLHSRQKDETLLATRDFALNEFQGTEQIDDLFLAQREGGYLLELRGRSGEPRPGRSVQLALRHREFVDPVQVTLQTDEHGRITLGMLPDIDVISATPPGGITRSWPLLGARNSQYATRHAAAGSVVSVPYPEADRLSRADVSLLELRGGTPSVDHFEKIQAGQGYLHIQGLPPGEFELSLKRTGQTVRILIADGPEQEGHVLGSRRHLELRDPRPMQIRQAAWSGDALTIQLEGTSPQTRVHVIATRFVPEYDLFASLAAVRDHEPRQSIWPTRVSHYVTGRDIGEEYRYILERKFARKYPGNLLQRPSPLLNPWDVRDTATERQEARAGDEFAPAAAPETLERGRQAKSMADKAGPPATSPSLDFLPPGAVLLLNLAPDGEGRVVVGQEELGDRPQLHVLAVDARATAYRPLARAESPQTQRDLRLAAPLDPTKHFTRQKNVSLVAAGESFRVDDLLSARFEYYDSLAAAFGLLRTLNQAPELTAFEFATRWDQLTTEEKREKYAEYACHELHLFIYHKDRPFFEDTIRPYLSQKYDKTFLDAWLLDAPLETFLSPWRYQRLNTAERILLGRRMAEETPRMQRHIGEQFHRLPFNFVAWNSWFEAAVMGKALDDRERLGRGLSRSKLGTDREFSEEMPPTEAMGEAASGNRPAAPAPATAARRGAGGMAGAAADGLQANEDASAAEADSMFGFHAAVQLGQQLYLQVDGTKEWAENNYYRLPIEAQTAELVAVNAFWHDYAQHAANGPFLSRHFSAARGSLAEVLLALSVLDLPFRAEEHETAIEGQQMVVTAGSPMIVFHEQIREVPAPEAAAPVLVNQSFFRHGDRYQIVGGQRIDKFVSEEYLTHTVYGCQVVVTNTSSTSQRVDLLTQIPEGAVPVLSGKYTQTTTLELEPYRTQASEFYFYFPVAGDFAHFPVHVAQADRVIAHAEPVTMHVVAEPTLWDKSSWDYVSQRGSSQDVLDYLQQHNVQELDLNRILFRMQDKEFFAQVVDFLSAIHVYHHELWSYSVLHNMPELMKEYLQHADGFVAQCGPALESPILPIDPVARHAYQHLDYRPLVNARAHLLGSQRRILNGRLHQQYHRLLDQLAHRPQLHSRDWLAVTYYLLLQDRIDEALAAFGRVREEEIDSQLQYDYFAAYLDCFQSDPALARELVHKHVDHPVPRWRDTFRSMQAMLAELEGRTAAAHTEDPAQRQAELASRQPGFSFVMEDQSIHLEYQKLQSVEVHYYLMDVELLFSRNPFAQQFAGQFTSIEANHQQVVALPQDSAELQLPIPEELARQNLMVEITSQGKSQSAVHYTSAMSVRMMDDFGQLQVSGQDTGSFLPGVYVKVYAEHLDGSVHFYKDGYTDLRGRFDYTGLSTNQLDQVRRFALLVLSDKHGAIVRETLPPKR